MADTTEVTRLPTKCLRLDRRNPRLVEFGVTGNTPEKEIVEILWDTMDVQELVQSIAASGYFEHEPLIVVEEGGKRVVIEGNRRLAAVRVLLDNHLADAVNCRIRIADKSKRRALEHLPVLISDRASSWRYLGFKHVNGPAKWSSYAKAQYIAEVHRNYDIPLTKIAEQIGDRHKTVQRLYRGLMVVEQAENSKIFDREDRYRRRFAFSHLYTGLDYEGISRFLSLRPADSESPQPVPKKHLDLLKELLLWLYGSKKQDQRPLINSQNPDLRKLDSVLSNTESLAALRSGHSLDSALEFGRDAADILEEALLRAKRELTRASAHLTIGYKKSKTLLRVAEEISDLADDIYRHMERRHRPTGETRRSGRG